MEDYDDYYTNGSPNGINNIESGEKIPCSYSTTINAKDGLEILCIYEKGKTGTTSSDYGTSHKVFVTGFDYTTQPVTFTLSLLLKNP